MQLFPLNYSDINWGPDEATGDYGLNNYFVECPGFQQVLAGNKRYLIGRKGTGKSAVLQKVRLLCNSDPTMFYTDVSLRNFPINDFKLLGNKQNQDKSKYVSAWEFLVLVEVVKAILKDNSIPFCAKKDELNVFITQNFPNGISMSSTIENLRSNQNKVFINAKYLGSDNTEINTQSISSSLHFNLAVDYLKECIAFFDSSSIYYILADELDEGYKEKDANIRLVILSLLRACENLSIFFSQLRIKFRPIVALRSDIFDNLDDNDLNKLDDYVWRLSWSLDNDSPWSLKKIVEFRLRSAFIAKYPNLEYDISVDALWNEIFNEDSAPRGLWKYICIMTFNRPRDIIKLLKYCNEFNNNLVKLTYAEVQSVEEEYSSWLYREFRDEVQSFLPCWKSVLNCLSEISRGKERINILDEYLAKNTVVMTWLKETNREASYIIELLFSYSVIGCINEYGRWIFKYKDDYFEFMKSYPYYCVHYGFCKKLRIIHSYTPLVLTEIYTKD